MNIIIVAIQTFVGLYPNNKEKQSLK